MIPNVEHVQNTLVSRQVIMSKHCVLSCALLRLLLCISVGSRAPSCGRREGVFADGRGRTHRRDISVSPAITVGSRSSAGGREIVPTPRASLLAHWLSGQGKCSPCMWGVGVGWVCVWGGGVPTSLLLLRVRCPSGEHVRARKPTGREHLGGTVFCCSTQRWADLLISPQQNLSTTQNLIPSPCVTSV